MTVSFTTQAEIRFGYGRSMAVAPPENIDQMLASLRTRDALVWKYPIRHFNARARDLLHFAKLRKKRRKNKINIKGVDRAIKRVNKRLDDVLAHDLRVAILRPMVSPDGFRERLVRFWADHFTVSGKSKRLKYVASAYVDEAIRPHIAGTFGEMLRAAVTHPAMLVYLDQVTSIGPNSPLGKKTKHGLNENLAREIMELHTLGVGAPYSQKDVREFAKLLTGLRYSLHGGFKFSEMAAEPGAETVLGHTYGGDKARLSDIYAALDALAVHPSTAKHIARKLVVHFVSDTPDEALVRRVEVAFRESNGDLMACYEALLRSPAAWAGFGLKARQPFDFVTASMRALNISPKRIAHLSRHQTRLFLHAPLMAMGQPYLQSPGPDGWPESVTDWITPQGLAARIEWSLITTNALGRTMDPGDLVDAALGDAAGSNLFEVTSRAETRLQGMALVLASPEFNRR